MKIRSTILTGPGVVFFAVAIAFALIVLSFFTFRVQVDDYIDQDMRSQIDAIQKNSMMLVQNEMNHLKRLTASVAQIVSRIELQNDAEIVQTLRDYAATSNIVRTLFITLDGFVYTNYAGYLGQAEPNPAIDGIALQDIKEPRFSQPYYAEELDEVVFGVVAPATMGGKQGVLVSSYNISDFTNLLDNKLIDGSAEVGIINHKGEVMVGKNAEEFKINIFDSMERIHFTKSSVDTMRSDFLNGQSGFSIYLVNGIARYCSYAPVGLNDWYVLVMVKENSLRSKLENLEQYGMQLTIELVIVMLSLLAIIMANRRLEQKKIRGILEEAAMMDGLTGIYNRKAVEETIETLLREAGEDHDAALLVLDVDDFKQINDQGGHLFGDRVLKECASRLKSIFETEGIVGRIGGDEFVAFLRDGRDTTRIADQINELICGFEVMTDAGEKQKISISVGIAQAGPEAHTFLNLYQLADAALYRAKQTGKGRLSD